MAKKISVVIPLYNKEKSIKRALESVLAQDVSDMEIIIVDDGSTDQSASIVEKFSDSRIVIFQQENMGVSAARNRGIDEAKSDFIAFLDADDEWRPDHINTLIRLREKYPNAGAYATAHCYNNGCIVRKQKYGAIPPPPWEGVIPNYFRAAILGDPPICSSAVGIPKYIFSKVGYFLVGSPMGEDLDMWFRIALKYPIAFSHYMGAIYHLDSSNRASYKNRIIIEEPLLATARRLIDKGEVPDEFLNDIKEYLAKNQICISARLISSGNKNLANCILSNCETREFYWTKTKLRAISICPSFLINMISKKYREFNKVTNWWKGL